MKQQSSLLRNKHWRGGWLAVPNRAPRHPPALLPSSFSSLESKFLSLFRPAHVASSINTDPKSLLILKLHPHALPSSTSPSQLKASAELKSRVCGRDQISGTYLLYWLISFFRLTFFYELFKTEE